MFGSRIFGKREVVSEILEHSVFMKREAGLTKDLAKAFGQVYIRLFGWPVSEPRIYHSRLVKLLEPRPSDLILDVGCGPGVHALEIASTHGATITGVDIDESDIRFADRVREVNHIENCRFKCMDATSLKFEPETFDKVVCMAVLEHIDDDNQAVKDMARVLRKGGILVGAVPNEIRARFKPDNSQRDDDPKGHGHVREGYSVQNLGELMRRNGLRLIKHEYVSGQVQNLMLLIEERTNRYLLFPLTYPVACVASRLSKHGSGILFKAVKESNGGMSRIGETA